MSGGIGHLKIITENLIKFNLQIFDPGALPLLLFQSRQPVFSLYLGFSQGIYLTVVSFLNNPTLFGGNGGFLFYGTLDQAAQVL